MDEKNIINHIYDAQLSLGDSGVSSILVIDLKLCVCFAKYKLYSSSGDYQVGTFKRPTTLNKEYNRIIIQLNSLPKEQNQNIFLTLSEIEIINTNETTPELTTIKLSNPVFQFIQINRATPQNPTNVDVRIDDVDTNIDPNTNTISVWSI